MSALTASKYPFILLRPVTAPPRTETLAILRGINNPANELAFIFEDRQETDVLAFDIETTGTDVINPETKVVGVGLADSRGSVYIDLVSSTKDTWPWLLTELGRRQVPLIMHNAYFDYSFIMRDMPASEPLPILAYCTYALFRLTSTEDWDGFSWGLKAAQKHLLNWRETNEKALDKWLLDNGYIKTVKKKWANGYTWVESIERWCKPDKSKMHLAPAEILGHYCALDADSTYLLFTQVLWPCLERFKALKEYSSPEIYGRYIRLMIEQLFNGMYVDIEQMQKWNNRLENMHQEVVKEFYQHPDIQRAVEYFRKARIDEHLQQEPEKFAKKKVTKEPNRLNKSGKVNKGWLKWKQKQEEPDRISTQWNNWKYKLEELEKLEATELLNLNSPKQKIELFYKFLKFPVLSLSKKTGEPGTGKDAIKGWGEIGKILTKQNKLIKEKQYAEKVIQRYLPSTNAIHPGVIVPGTSSGRLAGNIQQMPKSREFLECWKARPGYKLVELDFSSLEQVIMTELTRDPTLLSLYGPNAPVHQDVYLFNGSHLPIIGEAIRKSGYDPENPTKETIENAKKECKKERNISKTITLGSTYGMGPVKLQKGLELEGVKLTEEEARQLHSSYWKLYQGIKDYEKELIRQWRLNKGWYLNAIGRPMALTEEYIKDICNRTCQSGGHDALVFYIVIVASVLDSKKIDWKPWLIDMHDEMIIEVKEEHAEEAAHLMQTECLDILNKKLQGLIPLKGEAVVTSNWGEIKC